MRRLILILLALALGGCAMPHGAAQEEVEARGHELDSLTKSKIVSVVEEPYLAAKPVPIAKGLEQATGVLARYVTFREEGTIAQLCTLISTMTNLPITIDTAGAKGLGEALPSDSQMDAQLADALGVNGDKGEDKAAATPASITTARARIAYKGNVKGLLDRISTRFGLAWEYNPATGVVFAATAIRTFTIIAAPGQVSFTNSITNSSGGDSGGSSSGSSSEEISGETSQTNKTALSIDIWKDIEANVKSMLSPSGSVMGNQAAGTITVKDTATSLKRIETYIEETNERLARQIALSIKVWSLDITDSADVGLALSMFFENPDVRVFSGSSSALPEFSAAGGELSAAIVDGKLKDSTSLLKALRSVGKATQVTSGGGVAMNNQPMPIQAVNREAYLASSSFSRSDSGTDTTTLEPGEITTGFSMTVVPHILEGRRVVLQYTVNLSSLDDIQEFSSGDSKIQLPKVSSRSYSQRMTLKMGQTLVLAGFEQTTETKSTSGGLIGVGRGKKYAKSLMVVTISTESGDM